ncbi:MAG: 2-hydroxyacyl-CoA dehydratase [Clostridia bacterium]|nr:2-hydroxyacyl-CoA dehydratase [Clostridia bacterium]
MSSVNTLGQRTDIYALGIDIGSTTVKVVLYASAADDKGGIGGACIYEKYVRHYSAVREKTLELLREVVPLVGDAPVAVAISGSAGLGLSEATGVAFVQEVFATGEVVKTLEPDTSCVIELGGEDAKIIFFDSGIDERMNGSCAGGTGAFIDQMATLLNVSVDEMDEMSLKSERLYPIASRCGVFAKTDIQPLLNQGARKEDVSASIYQAVVNQTIAGLAQGKRIRGKVLFLGGPLYYCKGLRIRFKETLGLDDAHAVFPPYARFSVAMGASMYARRTAVPTTLPTLIKKIEGAQVARAGAGNLEPLFNDRQEYEAFAARHAKATLALRDIATYSGRAYLGIDCGSTTTKLLLLSEDNEILYTYYASNRGNPVQIVREQLQTIYALIGDRITIAGSAVTGYGEELIKHAFSVDMGLVETIAHYTAARHFQPDVDFILDIGGQDIKCFRVRNGAIDSIMLNEACSSGCGSFLETFARAMGCSIDEFAKKGLESLSPVNLGSRCTVFMNSSVKQSQKDGASLADISAGLSVSVVKNAIYKVIRAGHPDELGQHIVVQGGTFCNDAVLRAFERELGREVIRPAIAGLMGALGAALCSKGEGKAVSSLIGREALESFVHEASSASCHGCTNRCRLTINKFAGGARFISGNQCEKGLGLKESSDPLPNLYAYKRDVLTSLERGEGKRGRIGLPLSLGMYELLPLWHTIFRTLGFTVEISPMSTRRTYEAGQFSIPSDTACYPAKIMHGHIEKLLAAGVDAIFYPILTYNVDEGAADNHYNCPVVAYYSELLRGNVDALADTNFLYPALDINNEKALAKGLLRSLKPHWGDLTLRQVREAVAAGLAAQDAYREGIRREGERALAYARAHGKRVMILAGRPYHIDAEIGHGIDKLATTLGFVVVSEDAVCHLAEPVSVRVLNQWTYHARLYRAAAYAAAHQDTELVQLVSFGCGVDAITTDEVRAILEENGKYYTQLKIDEITNLGAVKIRLRSLIGAIEDKERKRQGEKVELPAVDTAREEVPV